MLLLAVVVLVVGVLFGVKVLAVSGTDGTLVLLFGMLFLNTMLLYVVFTQLVHVRDDIASKGRRK
jgi:2-phospho-L-lactate transferase/gluconeogenesis factor (CofD/UPF0052 family)